MDKPTPNTRSVSALERIRNAAENKYVRVGSAISIGLGSLSLAGCADPTPNVDPTSTSQPSPETPSETPHGGTEFAGIPTVESLQMSSELAPEQAAERVTNIISDWLSAGANQENVDLRYEGDNGYLSQTEYIQKIVDAALPVYAEALYGPDWQNPIFADDINRTAENHFRTLGAYFTTQGPDFSAPYVRDEKLVEIRSVNVDGDVTAIEMVIEYSDNALEIGTEYTINGGQNLVQLRLQKTGDKLFVSAPIVYTDL